MKISKWLVPMLLRLTSASGNPTSAKVLSIGFALSAAPTSTNSDPQSSQPRDSTFSLGLDFFVQVVDYELKLPIMPLHLLGKKSWNVYNTSNIEKVRRDEAIAQAAEEAEEQRMQEIDSVRRIQILRGEELTPIEAKPHDDTAIAVREKRERNPRKKAGENDTDFEMRLAGQQTSSINQERQIILRKSGDAPIVNERGHIDLFPQEKTSTNKSAKNAEAEKELQKKKKEYEDQYTVKFSNAAGFKQGLENPWYSNTNSTFKEDGMIDKDVWGNEDKGRREREVKRIVSSDPLAVMRQGAKQAREVDQERRRWKEEREREMRDLESEEQKKRKRRRNDDDLEGFSLDNKEMGERHRHKRRHSHRGDDDRRHKHKHRRHSHD